MNAPNLSEPMRSLLEHLKTLTVESADRLSLDELLVLLEVDPDAETITLCCSSRYGWAFNAVNRHFTRQGLIVLSIGDVISSDADLLRHSQITPQEKVRFELLHLKKMRRSQSICFINLRQHFGVSVRREYAFARRLGLPCLFAEVARMVIEEGSRIDYQIDFIDDPVDDGEIASEEIR
jgi:hypothetical protein